MFRAPLSLLLVVSSVAIGPGTAAFAQFAQASPDQYPQQGPDGPQPGAYPPNSSYPDPQAGYGAPPPGAGGQPADTQDMAGDRQHGVARISLLQGDVNLRRGDGGVLTAAVVNAPLVSQDHLQTSQGSRAEVELDYANLVRLAPDTDLGLPDLQYHRYQLQLGAGSIVYRVLRNSDAQIEIDTPSIALRPVGLADLRVTVLDDGTTRLSVRAGEAEIFGQRGSEQITAGRSVLVRGNPQDPEFQETYPTVPDQFDEWSANRDRELEASQSYRYVSPDVGGADDLDRYGNWVPSQYGQVWTPQAPGPDWSPYSDGQWTYEPYYGWTWVDAAPWGWAPYHYGRWFHNGGYGWCWWPGALRASYVWNPALVGFFGWGGGVGIGVGWVALAPFEIFHPWWGRGGWYGDHFRSYGGYGRVDVGRLYRNAAFRGGAITASYYAFGGPNHRFTFAGREQLTNASLFRGQLPVSPNRASYQLSTRTAVANGRLAVAANRSFVARQQFIPGSRGGFAPNAAGAANRPAPAANAPAQHGAPPNLQTYGGAGRNNTTGGWQHFGTPSGATIPRQNFSSNEQSGWHSFGRPEPRLPATQSRPASPSYKGLPGGNTFNGAPHVSAPAPSYSAPRYSAPAPQHFSAPYSSPRYSAPAPSHYSAPAPSHYSAPSRSSGGGGASHSGGSGGGSHSGGGGGHHR